MSDGILRNPRPRGERGETVSEDEHIREIKEIGLERLGDRIGEWADCGNSLAEFGSGLGLDCDIRRVEMRPKPYKELLKTWSLRCGSTVRVLRTLLQRMKRDDCVELLDQLRARPVHLNIRVNWNSISDWLHPDGENIIGRKTLMEHVRPNVVRFLQSKICFKAGDSILVRMKAIASHGWNSPSEDFEGQQIDIYIKKMDLQARPVTDPAGGARNDAEETPAARNVTRNASSECNEFVLYWEYASEPQFTPAEVLRPGQNSSRTAADSSLGQSDVASHVEIRATRPRPDVVGLSTDIISLRSNLGSLRFENDFEGASVGRMRTMPYVPTSPSPTSSTPTSPTPTTPTPTTPTSGGSQRPPLFPTSPTPTTPTPTTPTASRCQSRRPPLSPVNVMDLELRVTQSLPGYLHLDVPANDRREATEQRLSRHLDRSGCYVIRLSRTGTPRFSISVTHNRKIVHLGIIRDEETRRYCIFVHGEKNASLENLINYYRTHSIDNHQGLYLTTPSS